MKKIMIVALAFAGMGYAGEVCAQEQLNITLEQAIEVALSENPTIKVAEKDVKLKKIANDQAWQSLLPTINATGTLQHTLLAAKMNFNGQTVTLGRDNTNTAALVGTLQLPIFAPAVYQTMRMTRQDIELAREKARGSRLDMIHQVTKAYYQLLLARDALAVTNEALKVSEESYRIVESRYNVGSVSEYDKLTAEVQMRKIKSSVVSTESALTLAELQLKVLMGIDTDAQLVPVEELKSYEERLKMVDAASETDQLANNTTMRQFDLNQGLLKKNLSAQYANLLPTIAFTLTGQYQAMYQEGWNVPKYDPWPASASFTFSVSVPIFNASHYTKIRTARVQLAQLEDNRVNTERQLNMAVQSYRKNMQSALAEVESDKEAVNQAAKAVTISQKKYEVGKGTVLDMNQSQLALTQAKLTYDQAVYDYITNKADLDYTLGKE